MSGSRPNVNIRIGTEGADKVKRDLEAIGAEGERAGRRIQGATTAASPGLQGLAGSVPHQGVVAVCAAPTQAAVSFDDLLNAVQPTTLILLLDGVTDPHNLGACLRVADGAGAHAVVAPKDHAVGLNATVAKVASGAAETVPYLMVTNLARTLGELQDRGLRVIGTSDDAPHTLYDLDLSGPVALVLGAEGAGMRQLTRKTCDELVRIPMQGAVESLNVSVAAGVGLFEAMRQRAAAVARKK
jgi:23S rRNA (guanosine2251-2'-O)-methyltransferase